MSSFLLLAIVALSHQIIFVLSDLTRERFEEFRAEVIDLISCGSTEVLDDGITIALDDEVCTALGNGLTIAHPDVSIYDLAGGTNAGVNMAPGLLRLAFHDCAGIDVNKVKSGNTNFFTNPSKNGKAGGCNGCIGIENVQNDNLLHSAILPIEDICNEYKVDGISRADCWALAATISVEWTAANLAPLKNAPFFQPIEPAIKEGDIPYYYGRSDCLNDYEAETVPYPFSNPVGVSFDFPDPTQGWKEVVGFFKKRFGWNNKNDYFTSRDIISLISGGHSIGRAHERVAGYSGAWDFSPNVMDNNFVSTLYNEESLQSSPGFNIVQNRFMTTRHPEEPGSLPNFQVKLPAALIRAFRLDQNPPFYDGLIDTLQIALNTDFSMVYDISYYVENGKELEIDCVSNAAIVCDANKVILTAPRGESSGFNRGKDGDELGEQYECGEGEVCCEYIQCPIQCEGGWIEYNRLIDNDLIDTVDDDSDCPAAIGKKYSQRLQRDVVQSNRDFGTDFAKAFTKMITIGYVDKKSGEVLLKKVPDAASGGVDNSDRGFRYIPN